MSKSDSIKAVKGMNDILPEQSATWHRVETECAHLFTRFGYQQIRTPIVESTQLFARSIGEETDIVSKEMYTFADRNDDSLTLRPEGTASTVRAGIQNGLFYNQQQRLWYQGPMFRYERPQKGRYRQFHQIGLECYGWSTTDIEAEVLSLTKELFTRLGLKNTSLHINSLGDRESRKAYRAALVDYLSSKFDQLDADSQRRLNTNPLRILDSKNEEVQTLLVDAPSILDYLSNASNESFEQLQSYLQALDIDYVINSSLVRGLDYYNDTVFEWINPSFGAQSTVCGGGRYDHMVEQLGGQPTPAFGFGMGVERLIQMLQEQNANITDQQEPQDVYIVSTLGKARSAALGIQKQLVTENIKVLCHMGEGSFKNQFKKADKSGARIAVVIGDDEIQQGKVGVKTLLAEQKRQEQQLISENEVADVVTNLLKRL